jgi:prophage regulatory protein
MKVVPFSNASQNGFTSKIDPILRLPQVQALTGLGKTSIYAAMRLGKFPVSTSLGERAIGWFESDIAGWLESRRSLTHKEAA